MTMTLAPHGQPVSDAFTAGAADGFLRRHIGPDDAEITRMLSVVGYPSLDALMDAALPPAIRDPVDRPSLLPPPVDEAAVTAALREIAGMNRPLTSMIGLGYYRSHTPAVIRRNVLENPAWYTAYTPYQPEISQGRLEALLVFQTMIEDLTGLDVAGASLLDEPTAAAEAVALCRRMSTSASRRVVVDRDVFPQTRAVLQTRAKPMQWEVVVADLGAGLPDGDFFAVLVQNPGTSGRVRDYRALTAEAHARGAFVIAAVDVLSLALLPPPGEWGADVAVGSAQRFGVPLWYGGPHAGFLAARADFTRSLPGRLVGVSVDGDGRPAYRLALQTREQHIRREKATSNICTAQVLLAVVAAMYAVYHGPDGLQRIARRVHDTARTLAALLRGADFAVTDDFFDTVEVSVPGQADRYVARALDEGINIRRVDADTVAVSCDETTTLDDLRRLAAAFGIATDVNHLTELSHQLPASPLPRRDSEFLTHPTFHRYRSETAMMRYLRRLADKDIALDRSMIPLGSCTMKLNAAVELEALSWPEFADIHPFVPADQAAGYHRIVADLQRWLADLTGYDAVSLQPNAGSQGEFAGLLAIRAYHQARGEGHRDVCLIPASAHGTNAASAAMAGFRVVVVRCDADGNVDLDDLEAKLAAHQGQVAAIMLTYPSTHGVFEEAVTDICQRVHEAGGQVYLDGANLNALLGYARFGAFGADVSHVNLHKTFCIPHGGGGPGVGPIGVRAHLAPYLPNHPLDPAAGPATGPGPVAGAPYGSPGVLPISWAYLRLMGIDGLRRATDVAVLAANYVARRLADAFPVLYTGRNGLVAHECILDLRDITRRTGITVEDVAKRLMDYGFHAPTMSFPVAGTLMVEPTESENLAELDRFVAAMRAIRAEIARVERGEWPADDNPLRNAPHTALALAGEWRHPYSREEAFFPLPEIRENKYFPPVARIDGAYGDRHLVCECPPLSAYED